MIQTTIIILSQDTQERIAQESLLRQIFFSSSLSIVLLSNSLPHFFSLPLSYCFILSLSLSFSFSFSFLFVYAWTHTVLCCTVLYCTDKIGWQLLNYFNSQTTSQNNHADRTANAGWEGLRPPRTLTIFSLHHFSHVRQESWFAQRNNDIFTTHNLFTIFHDIFTIFSRLTIFSWYFQDISRIFHDLFTIFSRSIHDIWKSSFASFQSFASKVVSGENIVKISWKYRQYVAHSKLSKILLTGEDVSL